MLKAGDTQFQGRLLPGLKPVLELLHTEPQKIYKLYCKKTLQEFKTISSLAHKQGIPVELATPTELDSLCARQSDRSNIAHQGVIAILTDANLCSVEDLFKDLVHAPMSVIVALDQVQDPGNLGTICRTAWALGCAGIILPKHNSSGMGAAAFKASAGTLDKMPISVVSNLAKTLDYAAEQDIFIYGASGLSAHGVNADLAIENVYKIVWNLPAVLVLGNENKGIRPGVLKRCQSLINIPFGRDFDSLNIAQAGAIILAMCAAWMYNKHL